MVTRLSLCMCRSRRVSLRVSFVRVADASMKGMCIGRMYRRRPSSLYSGQKSPHWVRQCASSTTMLMIRDANRRFFKSFSKSPFGFISCSGLMTITSYWNVPIAFGLSEFSPEYRKPRISYRKVGQCCSLRVDSYPLDACFG